MATKEARLQTYLLETSQAAKEQLINQNIIAIAGLLGGAQRIEPQMPNATIGQTFIVGNPAFGDWIDKSGKIAYYWAANTWLYIDPPIGCTMYVIEANAQYRFVNGVWERLETSAINSINGYSSGDVTLATDDIPESANKLYFTQAERNRLNDLSSGLNSEQVQDIVAAFTRNSNTIAFSYNDSANTISYEVVSNSSTQKITALKNGTVVGTRSRFNFIPGDNVTLNFTDDPTNDKLDITINATGGSGSSLTDKIISHATQNLTSNSHEQINLALGRASAILNITSNRACRVRFYLSAAYRTADLNRPLGVDPAGEHGVLLDVVSNNTNKSIDCSPLPIVAALTPNSDQIPITITNLDSTLGSVSITISYLSF